MLKNKYGYFSEDHREYVITDPGTPRPWFNYIWNENYGGLVSHTGGGFSFLQCPRDNRLSRMRYNCLPWDRPGRYIMLKDKLNNDYWSLSWAPTIEKKYDFYECRHGQGYTTIKTKYRNISASLTYFVPRDKNVEIWRVSLKNEGAEDRELEIYSFLELMMGNALNDIINQPNDKHFTDIKFNKEHQTLVATRRYWVLNKKVSVAQPNISWENNFLFGSTLPVEGFDSSLDSFIGRWRSEANPESVETGIMHNKEITAGDPVAALKSSVNLEAGETGEFAIIMGAADKDKNPFTELSWVNYQDTTYIDRKFDELKKYWDGYLSTAHVDTPDENMNAMVNVWNRYQTAVTFDMARNAGYYHGGLLFGTGIRDQFQDILGEVISRPDRVRKRLLNALQYQFSDGSTLHNFFKLTGSGEKTNHSDTPLWIPYGIIEYLNETGDFSILEEIVPWHDKGQNTVYEHMVRALDYSIGAVTERGMPKIMNGDWNDTLDHIGPKGKGETVWGAFFLAYILKKTFPLLEKISDKETLARWRKSYNKLKKVTNEYCWDGEWYLRAFRDNGEKVGSVSHEQGKIFLNAQTWSVISGLADKERADKALSSCVKYLETNYGMQICWPSYREVEDNVGLISRCVPGKKENGAVFNHASSWFVLAAILNGDKEKAWEIYSKMLPVNSSADIDRYETEPYVFSEYVTSPDHETENQASHSWLTGSAVWMYRIALDYILGFRTTLDGFTIEPKIPSSWNGFSMTRNFRGKKFNIKVINNSGENSISIDGEIMEEQFIDPSLFTKNETKIKVNLK